MADDGPILLAATDRCDRANLSLGGAIPFKWALYLYTRHGEAWNKERLGEGRDSKPYKFTGSMPKGGDRLVWSIVAADFDEDPLTIDITARIDVVGKGPFVRKGEWEVSRAKPRVFVTLRFES